MAIIIIFRVKHKGDDSKRLSMSLKQIRTHSITEVKAS